MHFNVKKTLFALGFICLYPTEGYSIDECPLRENKGLFGRIGEFRQERIARLYYTTSVTGYGSKGICIAEFLRQNFRDEWSLVEFQINEEIAIRDPHYTSLFQNTLKFFPKILEKNPSCSANKLKSIQHALKYSYLFKESRENLIVLPLMLTEQCDFALKSCKTHYGTYDELSKESEKIVQSLSKLFQEQSSLITKKHAIAFEVINLQYGLLDEAEKTKQLGILLEKQRKTEEEMAQLESQLGDMTKLMNDLSEDHYNHVVRHESSVAFDLSALPFRAQNLLTHLASKFAGKNIEIHTLLRNNSTPPHNITGHVLAIFQGADEESRSGHLSYARIKLTKRNIHVRVINPTFDTDQPYIKAILGHADPLPKQSSRFFEAISRSAGLNLVHTYHYRGDQVLNLHDCGRFSMIYLLAALKGRDPLSLSNYEIYQGFKEIAAKGYDDTHQRKYEWNPIPKVPSKFSRFIGGTLRASCDYPVILDLSVTLSVVALSKNLCN